LGRYPISKSYQQYPIHTQGLKDPKGLWSLEYETALWALLERIVSQLPFSGLTADFLSEMKARWRQP